MSPPARDGARRRLLQPDERLITPGASPPERVAQRVRRTIVGRCAVRVASAPEHA
jgi:hypothetical protein